MSTTYYLRLKDDNNLTSVRNTLSEIETQINALLEKEAELLHTMVTNETAKILDKDNFNKQFCSAADWYGSYPDESEDYHLRRICLETLENIEVEIGTYSSGSFKWRIFNQKNGYYDCEPLDEEFCGLWKEHKVFEFPRSKEQFKEFMKQYKDRVEIVDEYGDVFTTTDFLKKVDEYK